MERRRIWLSIVATGFSLLLLLVGVITVGAGFYLQEEDPPNLGAEYIGSERCASCHNARDAELWDVWNETIHAQTIRPANDETILGDLSDTDALTVTWPDGEERPITADDITYVIGGNYTQQYISVLEGEDGEDSYLVLPVVWNIPQTAEQEGLWAPFYADNWTTPERDWRSTCSGCHSTGLTGELLQSMPDFEFVDDWREGDVEIGIGCESCHGPGGNHEGGDNPMPRTPDAQVCGQCHAQGHDPSGEFPFPTDYQPGLLLDEGVFTLTGMDDETVWWPDGHARSSANQYSEWLNSGHTASLETLQESELAEDSCLRCHAAPPDPTDPTPDEVEWTLADAQYGITCVACHNPHPSESQPRPPLDMGGGGDDDDMPPARPLDVMRGERAHAWLRQVYPAIGKQVQVDEDIALPFLLQAEAYELCVSCHNSATPGGETMLVNEALHHPVQEMFEGRDMVETITGIPSVHLSEAEGPRCMTCHMPRTAPIGEYGSAPSHLLTLAFPGQVEEMEPDSCSGCHADLTAGDLQYLIDDTQEAVRTRLSVAWARLASVDEPESEDDNRGQYERVINALTFVQNDGSLGVHNYTYADALLSFAESSLAELSVIGADWQPTEAPAPTAFPSDTSTTVPSTDVTVSGGIRPATIIYMGLILLILLIAAFAFFRKSGSQEAN